MPKALIRQILNELKSAANPERKAWMEGYSASAMSFLGVPVPEIRKAARTVGRELKGSSKEEVLLVAFGCIETGFQEARQAAYEILEMRKEHLPAIGAKQLEQLGAGNDNWASVDSFSTSVAGRVWREGGVKDSLIRKWARSKDPWWRRTALVSTIPLNLRSRGGTGDPVRTLSICEMLVDDRHPMVVKALSWALREVIPHDPDSVQEFIDHHEDDLAALVLREVRKKLS